MPLTLNTLLQLCVKDLLRPFDPALKFISVKSVIFLSFWQGIVLAILEKVEIIGALQSDDGSVFTKAGTVSAGYQNFLICIEMFFAAIAMKYAFPISTYLGIMSNQLFLNNIKGLAGPNYSKDL